MSSPIVRGHEHTAVVSIFRSLSVDEGQIDTRPTGALPEHPAIQRWQTLESDASAGVYLPNLLNGVEAAELLAELSRAEASVVVVANTGFPFVDAVPTRSESDQVGRGVHPYQGSIINGGALADFYWQLPAAVDPLIKAVRQSFGSDWVVHELDFGFGLTVAVKNSHLAEIGIAEAELGNALNDAIRESVQALARRAARLALADDSKERHLARLRHRLDTQTERLNEATRLLTGPGPVSRVGDDNATADDRLSIVVVAYNMNRELARTVPSCLPGYQWGVADDSVEIVVVDNGSPERISLTSELAADRRVRLIRVEPEHANVSFAMNEGVRATNTPNIAVMIDGAHMLSPGVVHWAQHALRTYENAVVATPRFHLGPMQQRDSFVTGYDQTTEDALLESINWPEDGYRLFEISVFIGEMMRTWTSALIETSFLAMRRARWDEMGGANESFRDPAAGLLNLELLRAAVESTATTYCSLVGEATFHQFHGGTTSNVGRSSRDEKLARYRAEYEQIFGRRFLESPRWPVFVGSAQPKAMLARVFSEDVDLAIRQRGNAAIAEAIAEANERLYRLIEKEGS